MKMVEMARTRMAARAYVTPTKPEVLTTNRKEEGDKVHDGILF